MTIDRQKLQSLHEQVLRRAELKAEVKRMELEMESLEKDLFALKIDMHNQQVDVDLLNRFSLKNVFYDLTGKKEALLAKETSEARAAKDKYEQSRFQIEQNKLKITQYRTEAASLQGCEDAYWQLLQTGLNCAAGEDRVYVQTAMEERMQALLSELEIAAETGKRILEDADKTLENIAIVREWNMVLSGSAWDMSMQGYLGGSQKKIDDLKKSIGIFLWKLNGLPLSAPVDVDAVIIFPENYLRELAGKIGADERLCEADTAVRAAKQRLLQIMASISQAKDTIRSQGAS